MNELLGLGKEQLYLFIFHLCLIRKKETQHTNGLLNIKFIIYEGNIANTLP